jgi:hypothetical protein
LVSSDKGFPVLPRTYVASLRPLVLEILRGTSCSMSMDTKNHHFTTLLNHQIDYDNDDTGNEFGCLNHLFHQRCETLQSFIDTQIDSFFILRLNCCRPQATQWPDRFCRDTVQPASAV